MTALIPRSLLFADPERTSPRLSPDGQQIAWLAPHEGRMRIRIASLRGGEEQMLGDDTDSSVADIRWAADGRHVLCTADDGGDENWRLHAIDVATGTDRALTPAEGVQAELLAVEPSAPDRVLVALNERDPASHDVHEIDLSSGQRKLVLRNPGAMIEFVADADLTVRAGIIADDDGSQSVMVRRPGDAHWRTLLRAEGQDAMALEVVGVSGDGRRAHVLSSGDADTTRLLAIDCDTGATEVLAADPDHDVGGVRLCPRTRRPQYAVVTRERQELIALDPAVGGDLDALRGLTEGDFDVTAHDADDRLWIVTSTADAHPRRHWLYDRATGQGEILFDELPALSGHTLAPTTPFALTARDGLGLHGYLTFPVGVEPRGLPAVLVVHGGPWDRDVWGFDPQVQWLANRGYLCVQVNFRSSAGYGKAFLSAGDREHGGKVHDDLLDAVRWVTERGYADPERVAIYGGSYGGYAALIGATTSPEAFRCAVALAAPVNLLTVIDSMPPYWGPLRAMWTQRVGDPDTEPDFLWERSPLSRIGDLRVPLLLAQGANDPRVPRTEAEQLVEALRDRGVDHTYLEFADEGHGLVNQGNRLAFFREAEAFLARHLGGRAEP